MSDSGYITGGMNLPTGRMLDDGSQGERVGSVGPLRKLSPELRAALSKHIREIDEDDLEQQGKVWVDRVTGDEFRIVTTLVDPNAPGDSQIEAFCERGGMCLYLRPTDTVEDVRVVSAGSFSGWRAT